MGSRPHTSVQVFSDVLGSSKLHQFRIRPAAPAATAHGLWVRSMEHVFITDGSQGTRLGSGGIGPARVGRHCNTLRNLHIYAQTHGEFLVQNGCVRGRRR